MPFHASPQNITHMEDNLDLRISDELLAAFLDGNVTEDEALDVLSAIGKDMELTEILSLSEAIDAEMEKERWHIIPISSLAAANPENLCSFDCETFILNHHNHDIDHWSLLETAKANNWLREEGTPLHHVGRLLELKGMTVARKYDATVTQIAEALDKGLDVIAVVDKKVLDNRDDSEGKPELHAVFITGVDDNEDITCLDPGSLLEEEIEKDIFLRAWRCSSYYMVTASENVSYCPQPINVEDIPLDADLEELTEAIAENAHDIWARARMDEGWTYGPVRDDAKKQHPDLVPYAQLPDSEKEYDRIMAMNTLRLVRRLGFDIIKNS